jgi:lipopolysaccharide/colanic/teichoic acid biosynthesis glycosyltransferase
MPPDSAAPSAVHAARMTPNAAPACRVGAMAGRARGLHRWTGMTAPAFARTPRHRAARRPRTTVAFESLPIRERQRRALNIVVAVIGIVVTAPLMLLIAVVIRLTSPGPIIFRQTRVGVDRRHDRHAAGGRRARDLAGCPFTMLKFRTMTADEAPPAVWAAPDDPRVTPVGRVLRRYRLDELPQLFNVVAGDMNVVGPRPEQPSIVASLLGRIPGYRLRQRVLPGITGLAQVTRGYDRTLDDVRSKVRLDLEYVAHRSPREDARIMVRTIPVMLASKLGW